MSAALRIARILDRFAWGDHGPAADPLDAVADQNVARLRSVVELTSNLQALEAADAMTETLLDQGP